MSEWGRRRERIESDDNVHPFKPSWWQLTSLLTARTRIKRVYGASDFLEVEFRAGKVNRYSTGGIMPGDEIRYRRSGRRKIGFQDEYFQDLEKEAPEDRPRLTERETVGWLYVHGERMGAVRYTELELHNLFNDEFYELMYAISADQKDLATAILH